MLLGIDQSLTSTGTTIFDGRDYIFELIQTEKNRKTKCPTIDYTRRLMELKKAISLLIESNNISYMAMEGMSFGSRGSTVFDLGGLSHMIREVFLLNEVKFVVIPPKTLKKYWTGSGNANKEEMIEEATNRKIDIPIMKNYGTKKLPYMRYDDNIVDSLALVRFLDDYLEGKLPEYENVIEKSWDL